MNFVDTGEYIIRAMCIIIGIVLGLGLSLLKEDKIINPVVHGHWIHNTDDFTPKKRCSHCGYNKPVVAGENIDQEPDDFCNKCGAKMDEEAEQE